MNKNIPLKPTKNSPQTLHPDRSHGFILLIVLSILILATIISVAYLRTMRQRTQGLTQYEGRNIRLATDSVVSQALTAIANDMPTKGSGQEDYDFPWTDASASLLPARLSHPAVAADQFTKLFTFGNPARDDAWLASSIPEGGNWPHLTNLNGSFLNITNADLSAFVGVPFDQLSSLLSSKPSGAPAFPIETGIGLTDARLADADGDGIGDSLWYYPPVSQVGKVRYVAAVYIEDLSAKINVNTALPLRTGGAYAATLPKAQTPSDVDLSALREALNLSNAQKTTTDTEIANTVKYRSQGLPAYAYPDPTATPLKPWPDGPRRYYWGDRASKSQLSGETLGSDINRYTLADEIELRFHGGINDHRTTNGVSNQSIPVSTPVESAANGLQSLLRATNTTSIVETTYSDTPLNSATTYLTNNPRRWITTLNGDTARQVGLDSNFLPEAQRYNLNIANPTHFAATVGDTINLAFFRGPDGLDGTADDYPMAPGFARFATSLIERPSSLSGQWLCNLIDARDSDNLVTRLDDAAGGWYGFEPLPLLAEVYMQRGYYKKAVSGTGPYTLTCCASPTGATSGGNSASYAFELANPHNFPIKLTHVDLAVQLPGVAGGVAGGPYAISTDLTAAAWTDRDADGDPVLLPGHRLILWRNGNTADTRNDLTSMVNGAVALDSAKVHKIGCGMVLNDVALTGIPAGGDGTAGTGFVRVDLLCYSALKDGSGVQQEPGAYSTITVPWLPNTFTEATADAAVTGVAINGLLGFRQVDGRAFGIDQGLNLLQCRPARWSNLSLPNLSLTSPASALTNTAITGVSPNFGDTQMRFTRVRNAASPYSSAFQSLGATSKIALPAGRADLKNDKLWFNQQSLAGTPKIPGDRFLTLMDLLRIPAFGMRGTSAVHRGNLTLQANGAYMDTTCASGLYEMLEDGTKPLASLCISITPGTSNYNTNVAASSHQNVPFGWLLPCFYDTLNPAADGGLDVDGDNIKDWFSQGGVLGLDANNNGILDWPTEIEANNYLIPGRLNLNTTPVHLLAQALPITDATLRQQLANAIVARRNGAPTAGTRASTDRGLSSVFEVLQDAPSMSAFVGNPATRFDLVENFGCLPQVATCRSDFYAVHILVLGFNASNFSNGLVEQNRTLLIVSRAPLTSNSVGQLKYWSYTY